MLVTHSLTQILTTLGIYAMHKYKTVVKYRPILAQGQFVIFKCLNISFPRVSLSRQQPFFFQLSTNFIQTEASSTSQIFIHQL
jgi:hypothetical protein